MIEQRRCEYKPVSSPCQSCGSVGRCIAYQLPANENYANSIPLDGHEVSVKVLLAVSRRHGAAAKGVFVESIYDWLDDE